MNVLKSKTINFSIMLAMLGTVEANFGLLREALGDNYGASYIAIAVMVATLRAVTTKPLSDK